MRGYLQREIGKDMMLNLCSQLFPSRIPSKTPPPLTMAKQKLKPDLGLFMFVGVECELRKVAVEICRSPINIISTLLFHSDNFSRFHDIRCDPIVSSHPSHHQLSIHIPSTVHGKATKNPMSMTIEGTDGLEVLPYIRLNYGMA